MRIAYLAGCFSVAWVVAAYSADWPEFGGSAARNMVSAEKNLPENLTAAGTRGVLNLKWSVKIGAKSFGTPTISNGRILLGTNNGSPRDPRYMGDRGVLLCLDEKDGGLIWSLPIPKNTAIKSFDLAGLGICSSPAIEGNRAYLMSSRCEVLCVDMLGMANGNDGPFTDETDFLKPGRVSRNVAATSERANTKRPPNAVEDATSQPDLVAAPPRTDADVIWKADLVADLHISPHDATDCSPLVVGDILYVCSNNGVNASHKVSDNPDAPTLLAFDKNTGRLLATDDCLISRRLFHGNWSNPTLGNVSGKPAIFLGGGDGFLYAFDPTPTTGPLEKPRTLRKLWATDCNPAEHKVKHYRNSTGPSEIIGTPVFVDGRVYVAVGQDPNHGQGVGNLACLDANTGEILWNDPNISRSLSTVAVSGELLFIGDFSGLVNCYNARTGKKNWQHDTGGAIWGSTLVADGKVYVGNSKGTLTILAADASKKVLSENRLDSPIQSSPVAANGVLYVMSHTRLYAFARPAPLP